MGYDGGSFLALKIYKDMFERRKQHMQDSFINEKCTKKDDLDY